VASAAAYGFGGGVGHHVESFCVDCCERFSLAVLAVLGIKVGTPPSIRLLSGITDSVFSYGVQSIHARST
jgi:hypothetical protein